MADHERAEESDRSDEEQDRLNRQMTELLNELRVAMPGVQVLFAFLLAVPFQQRFAMVNTFQRNVYLVTLLAAATATAFLIAPSAYHRIAFQEHEKSASSRWARASSSAAWRPWRWRWTGPCCS